MNFGDRLKILREKNKLSREELAKILNISYSAVSKYETNIRFPDKDTIKTLADYFDVSIDYLLGRTNDKRGYIEPEEGIPKDNVKYKTFEEILQKIKDTLEKEGLIAEADPVPKEAIEIIFKHGYAAAIDILKLKIKQ